MTSFAELHDLTGKVALPCTLASAASSFTTGAIIRADGGITRKD